MLYSLKLTTLHYILPLLVCHKVIARILSHFYHHSSKSKFFGVDQKRVSKMLRKFSSIAGSYAKRLEGKVCVVTASTEGIGLAIAKRLGAEGGKVVVSSRKQANVDEAVKLLQDQGVVDVFGIACHVGNAADRKKLFDNTIERFGGLDILVSNAAVNPEVGQVLDASEACK
jgi:short chain dehydrogenase